MIIVAIGFTFRNKIDHLLFFLFLFFTNMLTQFPLDFLQTQFSLDICALFRQINGYSLLRANGLSNVSKGSIKKLREMFFFLRSQNEI